MKLKVLVDNNTYIDQYYCGEPGVSYYIEDEDTKLLLDVGYSDLFIQNAKAMGINIDDISALAISHGHDDHTRGLKFLFEQYALPELKVIAHPKAFEKKIFEGIPIGSPLRISELNKLCHLTLSKYPVKISEHIYFLGEIPQNNQFEKRVAIGQHKVRGKYVDDFVTEDTAIAYKGDKGVYIITGCSHSGICNIMEYAKEVCGDDRIAGVLGGFHLFEVDTRLKGTIEYFMQNKIKKIYACHCVSFRAKAEIHKEIPLMEVGVSMELVWE